MNHVLRMGVTDTEYGARVNMNQANFRTTFTFMQPPESKVQTLQAKISVAIR